MDAHPLSILISSVSNCFNIMTKRFSILNVPILIFFKHENGMWIGWYMWWEYRQLCHLQPFYQTHPALLDTQQLLYTLEQRREMLGINVINTSVIIFSLRIVYTSTMTFEMCVSQPVVNQYGKYSPALFSWFPNFPSLAYLKWTQ